MAQNIPRKDPELTVDPVGTIAWEPIISDHDAAQYYRGKTLTNKEFNDLIIKQIYQANYTADTLALFLKKHLDTAIGRKFENNYNLVHSYIHVITEQDWGELQQDGYYYIRIPAEAHGFKPVPEAGAGINIDTELYLCNPDTGEYHEVSQVTVDIDNTVTLYTDDPRVTGVVIIRTNERSYALSGVHITTAQISDLAEVAKTNSYKSLKDAPNLEQITKNTDSIQAFVSGEQRVKEATYASYVTGFIAGQPLNTIFETGTSIVKQATNAKNYISGGNIANTFTAINAQLATLSTTVPRLKQTLLYSFGTDAYTDSFTGGVTITLNNSAKFSDYDYIDVYYYEQAYSGILHCKRFKYSAALDTYVNLETTDTGYADETDDKFLKIYRRTLQFKASGTQLQIGQGTYGYLKRTANISDKASWIPIWVYEVNNMYIIPHSIYGGKFS